jgi:hypothetical protein
VTLSTGDDFSLKGLDPFIDVDEGLWMLRVSWFTNFLSEGHDGDWYPMLWKFELFSDFGVDLI